MKWSRPEFERADPRPTKEVLRYRTQRLLRFLENPVTPVPIIAEEIHLIFKAGMKHCGDHLLARLAKWIEEEPSAKELSLCSRCPSFKREEYSECPQCTKGDQPIQ